MKRHPTLAVFELASIAEGIFCTDALLKRAPIAMLKSGTVSRGRYLIILGGSTASVEESLQEALAIGQDAVLDHAFLPDVHIGVYNAVLGVRSPGPMDSVAILETDTVSANVRAAELALKGTQVHLIELRLAEYEMSGKAISLYSGPLHEVEAAMDLAVDFLRGRKEYVRHRIIAQPHEVLAQYLAEGTRFAASNLRELEGEEVS